jgi:hypothetical protein
VPADGKRPETPSIVGPVGESLAHLAGDEHDLGLDAPMGRVVAIAGIIRS